MAGFPILKEGWGKDEYMQRFQEASANGGNPIKGPLLVLQGEGDYNIDVHVTTAAVEKTSNANPNESISYII